MGRTKNPAYRPATEKALVTGLFLWTRCARACDARIDSSRAPAGNVPTTTAHERTTAPSPVRRALFARARRPLVRRRFARRLRRDRPPQPAPAHGPPGRR